MNDDSQWNNTRSKNKGSNYSQRKQAEPKYTDNKGNNYSPSASYNYKQSGSGRGQGQNYQQNPRRRIDRYKRESISSTDKLVKQNDIIIKLLKEIRDNLVGTSKTADVSGPAIKMNQNKAGEIEESTKGESKPQETESEKELKKEINDNLVDPSKTADDPGPAIKENQNKTVEKEESTKGESKPQETESEKELKSKTQESGDVSDTEKPVENKEEISADSSPESQ